MTGLNERARRLGVATEYDDWSGRRVHVADDVVTEVCDLVEAGGQPDGSGGGEPIVVRRGHGAPAELAELPVGYHTTTDQHGCERLVIVAPERCPALPERPTWGWMMQLYAMRSRRSWGMGDLADLRTVATWSARDLGADFLLINPLHAPAPGVPQQHSPYAATSRRFTNPLYLCLDDVPERHGLSPDARQRIASIEERARATNTSTLIERDEVYACKSEAWELLFRVRRTPDRDASFRAFVEREGPGLERFATWCALAEQHGPDWSAWPSGLRRPDGTAVARAAATCSDRVELHRWLQWLCDEQLSTVQAAATQAGMAVGIVHDLAVGVGRGSADTWAHQDVYASGVTIGAPPDEFNTMGQDWLLPPWRPASLRSSGYRAFRDMLGTVLRHAGGLRLDHALGLWRQWWIPDGRNATEGTYVRYPAEDLLAVLALEAHLAQAIVVAEDLGTVPPHVPSTLREWGIASSAVLWFEHERDGAMRPGWDYPAASLASVTTHDLVTASGFWRGEGTRIRRECDQYHDGDAATLAESADVEAQSSMLDLLRSAGLIGTDPSPDDLVMAMYEFLAQTPSRLLAVNLADAVGDLRQPNLPGTTDEYPNWRLPLADGNGEQVTLQRVLTDPGLRRLVAAVRSARPQAR